MIHSKYILQFQSMTITSFVILLIIFQNGAFKTEAAAAKIGVIIDEDIRTGKEIKIAMVLAAQKFNSSSSDDKISLHFGNPSENDPLQAALIARELVKEKGVHVIIAPDTWEGTALVADVGKQAQVPVISFVPTARQSFIPMRWPFLIQMGSNLSEQIRCLVTMIHSGNWKKVIPIYESDSPNADSWVFSALLQELQSFRVEVEYQVAFPPVFSLLPHPELIGKVVEKLLEKQSRVFIVLLSSLSLSTQLFREAKRMNLTGKDSVWIIMEPLTGALDFLNPSVVSSMEGALGPRSYFNEDSPSFTEFKYEFKRYLLSEYPEDEISEPGIHALRAYDTMTSIVNAMKILGDKASNSTLLLRSILSSNFAGLSGEVHFNGNKLQQSTFRIVNVVGKRYKTIGFWSPEVGFSNSEKSVLINEEISRKGEAMEVLGESVHWMENLRRVPSGLKQLRILVPAETAFEEFVKVVPISNSDQRKLVGFSIDVFFEILKLLNYQLSFELVPHNGTYNELVDLVFNKTFDGFIGDVTILAGRAAKVDFTQPYIESTLSLIVEAKPKPGKAWIFVKPFTLEMWTVTAVIFLYTVLIIWILERDLNPEFEGHWFKQLGVALWFTSTSLFYAHRERVQNRFTRPVVWVWLFLVLALTSCYTASLSSMLIVQRLQPNVTDIEWLKKTHATVGCGVNSFIRQYLENVLDFEPKNIQDFNSQYDLPEDFENGDIVAVFLESSYAKAFLNEHCKGFTDVEPADRVEHRFGGLGFAFQKGSPIVDDFSQAILNLSENGVLKQLESNWLGSSDECSKSTPDDADSLGVESFWGLYAFSFITSTLFCILFLWSGH